MMDVQSFYPGAVCTINGARFVTTAQPPSAAIIPNPLPLPVDLGIKGTRKPEPVILRRTGPRIGRNDLCPCGSGGKFKRCCRRRA